MIQDLDSPLPDDKRVEEDHFVYTTLLYISVFLFPIVIGFSAILPAVHLYHNGWAFILPTLFFSGLLASDFVSGLFHWFFDNYGSSKTPVFGQTIELFRVHHDLPQDICKSNFIFTVGHVCIWAVPLNGILLLLHTTLLGDQILFSLIMTIASVAFFFLVMTNQFHKWAHLDQPSPWIQFLQDYRLVLESQHHQIHHTAPYNKYYCITTGWLNPVLNKLQFFQRLELVLAWLKVPKTSENPLPPK